MNVHPSVHPSIWGDRVYQTPRFEWAQEWDQKNIKGLFYEGLPYQGKATRVFAYIGGPEMAKGEKVPSVVLVHGGGGTAFVQWVEIWNKRGYAAITMDLEGHVPKKDEQNQWLKHEWSGPDRKGIFDDISLSIREQWMFHAVGAVILAHSLLRSFKGVDPNRTGVTGISWGGIIVSLISGIDKRFAFAIPVYGCGYLYESLGVMGPPFREEKRKFWDPSHTLEAARLPMLWVNSDDDRHFSIDIFAKSFRKVKTFSALTIHPDMKHSHPDGWAPKEIYAFADSVVRGGDPLLKIIDQGYAGTAKKQIWLEYPPDSPIIKADLIYTLSGLQYSFKGEGPRFWASESEWEVKKLTVKPGQSRICAEVPKGTKLCYVNLTDERDCVVSSDLFSLA